MGHNDSNMRGENYRQDLLNWRKAAGIRMLPSDPLMPVQPERKLGLASFTSLLMDPSFAIPDFT